MIGTIRASETARLRRACEGRGLLALTYDDGPGPRTTPALLDLLGSRGARATFYLLGRRAERAPEVVERIVREGHETACHTHDHLHAWKTAPMRAAGDVRRGYETLGRWLPSPSLFRPPYGKLTPLTRAAARRAGSPIGWWTVDSGDTAERLPGAQGVVDRVRRAGGGVVLMHDFDREDADAGERAAFMLDLTQRLIDLADEAGMRITTQGELMGLRDNGDAA